MRHIELTCWRCILYIADAGERAVWVLLEHPLALLHWRQHDRLLWRCKKILYFWESIKPPCASSYYHLLFFSSNLSSELLRGHGDMTSGRPRPLYFSSSPVSYKRLQSSGGLCQYSWHLSEVLKWSQVILLPPPWCKNESSSKLSVKYLSWNINWRLPYLMKLQPKAVAGLPFSFTPAHQTQSTLRPRVHAHFPDKWPNLVKMSIGPHITNKGKWGIPEIIVNVPLCSPHLGFPPECWNSLGEIYILKCPIF